MTEEEKEQYVSQFLWAKILAGGALIIMIILALLGH